MSRKPQPGTSEDRIVHFLTRRYGRRAAGLTLGIGDDAAAIRPGGSDRLWVVTTDLLLEGVDFRRDWLTPAQLGHKSLAVNLSDLAAMGARPRFHTVALGLPVGLRRDWISSFYRGMTRLADACGTVLIGGDLSKSVQGIHVSITAIGESLRGKILRRSGGRAGDRLFVTGTLGLSAAGLGLLESGRRRGKSKSERMALKAHREPAPHCEAGRWLARSRLVSCMMDLSDGLSRDLPRLCKASRTGAEICASNLPVFPASAAWCCDPVALALHGGEDFELLFAVPEKNLRHFLRSYPTGFPPVAEIGRLTRNRAVRCRYSPGGPLETLPALGFDHFR